MLLIDLVKHYGYVEMIYMVHIFKPVCIVHTLFRLLCITDMQMSHEFKINIFYSHTVLINYEYFS